MAEPKAMACEFLSHGSSAVTKPGLSLQLLLLLQLPEAPVRLIMLDLQLQPMNNNQQTEFYRPAS